MSEESLMKFASALRSLHEGAKAMAHVLASLRTEAEGAFEKKVFPLNASQDEAQLRAWSSEPKFVGTIPPRRELGVRSLADEIDFYQKCINSALAVPPHVLDMDYAKHELRVLALMLQESGLPQWFDQLQLVVDSLRPDNDLLTFKRQVEALLNDERIRPFRTTHSGDEG